MVRRRRCGGADGGPAGELADLGKIARKELFGSAMK